MLSFMAKKISVVIPNYNGSHLLSKNLTQVLKTCPGCEVIVVDDSSTDDSVKLIERNFRGIKLIRNKKNEGFSKSVNKGVKQSTGSLVLLLNSDVSPKQGFLQPALKHFKSLKDKNLFAVGLCDLSHEDGQIVQRGRGGVKFTKGFITHFAARIKSGETLWVSGGSGLFNKEKFLELGGFDATFAPFYWEDIDLCFRAWKKGYKCLFGPASKVDHFHEQGIIKKRYSDFFIKSVSYKNQFLFVWKNIDDYFLIMQHILWQPYHFLKALLTFDLAFFLGFLWAVLKLPALVFNHSPFTNLSYEALAKWDHSSLSEKEVIKKFEKP